MISGCLGSLYGLYGAVIIARNISDLDAFGPAISGALLTVPPDIFLKAVIRLAFLSRNAG